MNSPVEKTAPVAHRMRQINTAFWKYSTNPPRLAPLERREDWVFEPLHSASTVEALKAENAALLSRVERLEKALKPFAEFGEANTSLSMAGDGYVWSTDASPSSGPNAFGLAARALKETKP